MLCMSGSSQSHVRIDTGTLYRSQLHYYYLTNILVRILLGQRHQGTANTYPSRCNSVCSLPFMHSCCASHTTDTLQVSSKAKPGGDMVTTRDGGGMAMGAWSFPLLLLLDLIVLQHMRPLAAFSRWRATLPAIASAC